MKIQGIRMGLEDPTEVGKFKEFNGTYIKCRQPRFKPGR